PQGRWSERVGSLDPTEVAMSVFHTPADMFEIGRDECLQLLGAHRVGRIAFVAEGQPLVFPVNYALDGETIVFRSDKGSKLTHAPLTKVAFDIDDIDEGNGEGWDVVVQGHADDITDALDERSEVLRNLPIDPFPPGLKWNWVRIVPSTITGRRIVAR